MFDATSRYTQCGDAFVVTNDGKIIKYKRRRFIPKEIDIQIPILEIDIVTGDRIDLISSKYLANPEQFWRLCDMNGIMHPLDLTEKIGKTIKIIGEE
jgi:hypothetical protein